MKLEDLKQDPVNARKHTPRNIATIVNAIQEIGCARSMDIDENGVILAGNGTYEALVEAGIKKIRVIEGSGDEIIAVQRTNLTDTEKARLSLYDNQSSDLASWDAEVIELLSSIDNIFDNIFSDKELKCMLNEEIEESDPAEPSGGEKSPVTCPKCDHEFTP